MGHFQIILDEFGTDELHKPSHDAGKPPLFGFAGLCVDVADLRNLVHDFVDLKRRTLPALQRTQLIPHKCDGTDIFNTQLTPDGVAHHHQSKQYLLKGKRHLKVNDRHTYDERVEVGRQLVALLEKHHAKLVYYGMTKATKPVHNGAAQHINVFAALRTVKLLNDHFTGEKQTFAVLFDWHTQEEKRKEKQFGHFLEAVRTRSALADLPVQANSRHSSSVQLADWVGGLCGRWLSYHANPKTHGHMKAYDDLFGSALTRLRHPASIME